MGEPGPLEQEDAQHQHRNDGNHGLDGRGFAMSAPKDVEEIAARMAKAFVAALQEAHDLGFQAGSLAMRESILKAASSPMTVRGGTTPMIDVTFPLTNGKIDYSETWVGFPELGSPGSDGRAPRGMVVKGIREVLTETPGITITEVGERVIAKYPQVSMKSVGNQLRRGEGTSYERSDKYSWYLKGRAPKETVPSEEDAALDQIG